MCPGWEGGLEAASGLPADIVTRRAAPPRANFTAPHSRDPAGFRGDNLQNKEGDRFSFEYLLVSFGDTSWQFREETSVALSLPERPVEPAVSEARG